jgi:KaiC/GvpD/RAD55 family RecA-like ATPase
MNTFGIAAEGERRVIFIDAYSALSGTPSAEQYSVPSVTDLTGLGLTLSKCLEAAGEGTDVFLDSLNPMLAALRVDYLLNFLQSTAARVKANGGRFYVSVGLGIDKSDMTKLEEASDCVIETQVQDIKNGQRRRMRIKKLRGHPYDDKWTRFRVDSEKGIVYLSRTKPEPA